MFRYFSIFALVCCAGSTASAQEFAQFQNSYHVEVRVEHWRFGNPSWTTEFTTNDYEEALLMLDLFELALDQGELRDMLGFSWQWLVTDVRLRTEYPWQLSAPVLNSEVSRLRPRPTYQTPTFEQSP